MRQRGSLPLVLGLVAVLLLAGTPALAQSEEEGQQVYDQKCASCHQAGGAGLVPTFPPLAGNERAGDADYVEDIIRNGQEGEIEVLGVTYDSVMPAMPQLTDGEIASVILYLQSISAPSVTTTTAPPTPGPGTGDAANGELLFTGSVRLSEGGPACFSCHAAGTYSQGGAGLGPDLTDAHPRLGGEAGLTSWLTNPPSQTMQPLYTDKPLTDTEIADLTAFLAETPGDEPSGVDGFLIGGLAGLFALLAIVAVTFKRPKPSYVDRLRSRS